MATTHYENVQMQLRECKSAFASHIDHVRSNMAFVNIDNIEFKRIAFLRSLSSIGTVTLEHPLPDAVSTLRNEGYIVTIIENHHDRAAKVAFPDLVRDKRCFVDCITNGYVTYEEQLFRNDKCARISHIPLISNGCDQLMIFGCDTAFFTEYGFEDPIKNAFIVLCNHNIIFTVTKCITNNNTNNCTRIANFEYVEQHAYSKLIQKIIYATLSNHQIVNYNYAFTTYEYTNVLKMTICACIMCITAFLILLCYALISLFYDTILHVTNFALVGY